MQAPPPAPAPAAGDTPAEEHRFACPQCGADMRFAAGGDAAGGAAMVCDHCGHIEAIAPAPGAHQAIAEMDFRRAIEARLPEAEIETGRYSSCPNCGAEVAFDPAVHATECPFCATPVVADTGAGRHIKPAALAPFVLTEQQARAAMTGWLGSLWFAPAGLRDYARKGRAMQGVYVPFWTYDADTASAYQGRRGTIHHEARRVQVRDAQGRMRSEVRQVATIRWAPASGRVARVFDDVLVLASRSLPERHTAALQPWDLTALRPYRPEYLAGFRAEGYTISLQEGMTEARARMDRMIERDVRFDIGGDRQEIDRIETRLGAVTFKHILLPVWLAAYRYRGRSYRFVVNGQTGRVQGERPWSAVKIAVAVILGAALAALAAWLAQTLPGGDF